MKVYSVSRILEEIDENTKVLYRDVIDKNVKYVGLRIKCLTFNSKISLGDAVSKLGREFKRESSNPKRIEDL